MRARIVRNEILVAGGISLYPLEEEKASCELTQFANEIRRTPKMEGYFDRGHFLNLREHVGEAQHGFATLPSGGIIEVIQIPALPDNVMGFQLLSVFDPRDDSDYGKLIGYTVYSLEKGSAPFGQAETVRMAFDILPPYREGRYKKVPFANHDVYNISRRILAHFRPKQFAVDAKTQIGEPRTGRRLKRTTYYLKRGYYPPDQKALADDYLVRLMQGKRISRDAATVLRDKSKAPFWILPIKRS